MLPNLSILTVLGLTTLVGFYVGQMARRVRLPSIIGYMVTGVLLGPSLLNLLNSTVLEHTSFISEMALGFIAFSIGCELRFSSLKRLGGGIVSIIFAESFAAFFVVLGVVYLVTRNLPLALIFGGLAPASAPAGTVAVIQEYRAKGPLTRALYAVVGFDDGLAIVIFGFAAVLARNFLVHEALLSQAAAVGTAAQFSEGILHSMKQPVFEILASLAVGGGIGLLFCRLISRLSSRRDMLIVVFSVLLIATGLSIHWRLSLILTNLMVGGVLANSRREALAKRATEPLLGIMPLIFVFFFCLAGAHLEIRFLPEVGGLGLAYILARSAGLIGGARLGAMVGHVDEKVKKYIGLGILSQAGVAIGLSLIVRHQLATLYEKYGDAFDHLLARKPMYDPLAMGATVLTTIIATSIVFEIIGPILTKVALTKAKEIPEPDR